MSDTPATWTWSTIGEVTQYIQRGKSPKYAVQSALPVINQKCIRWDELQLQHLKYIHPDQFEAWDESRYIKPGDILWNSTGTGTVGRAYLVEEKDCTPPKVVDSHVTIVRASAGLEPRYLFAWIKSPEVQDKIVEMCDGTTNQIELSRTAIAATAIPVAPAEEQTRIADQLDTLLARINACQQRFDAIPALLKRFRRAVLDVATTGALTQDWREHNSAPEWTLVALSDIAEVVGGVTKDSKKQSIADEEVPYLRVANVQRGYLDLSEIKTIRVPAAKLEKLLLEPGDVLFNEGGDLDKLGRGWVWDGQLDRCTFQNHVFRARLKDSSNQPKFISWWGNSRGLDYFIRSGKQTTNLASINKRTLEALPISLPSPEEQKEIVRRVDALLGLAARIEARFESMRIHALRLGPQVLAKAFRGELVQQNLQDEPASVLLQRIAGKQREKMKSTRGRSRINKPEPVGGPSIALPAWSTLPAGAWAAQVPADEHTATAQLIAVLKAWNKPAPQDAARLATLLCLQPRLLTVALPAQHATQWCRLVGDAATPLPARVVTLQSAFNIPWRNAISKMRARGDLIESDSGAQGTWAVGPGAAGVHTAGWPDGRAGWVVYYLKTHGVEAVLPTLETEVQEFVYARAA